MSIHHVTYPLNQTICSKRFQTDCKFIFLGQAVISSNNLIPKPSTKQVIQNIQILLDRDEWKIYYRDVGNRVLHLYVSHIIRRRYYCSKQVTTCLHSSLSQISTNKSTCISYFSYRAYYKSNIVLGSPITESLITVQDVKVCSALIRKISAGLINIRLEFLLRL